MQELNKAVITDVYDTIRVPSVHGGKEMMRNRKNYGISFCISGKITYRHKGREILSDPNYAVILPKGGNYEIHRNKTGIFPVINFDCLGDLCDTVTSIPIYDTKSYINDFEQIERLCLFPRNRAKVLSIFYDMLYRISQSNSTQYGILRPAIEYMETNYSDPALTNKTLADLCNISEVYFRKQFKNQFGISPKQYILNIRLQRAEQLLSEGIYKINTVAEKCGFSGQYHFSRFFKEKTGKSATEFMKENINYKI